MVERVVITDEIDEVRAVKFFKAIVLQAFRDATMALPEQPKPMKRPRVYKPKTGGRTKMVGGKTGKRWQKHVAAVQKYEEERRAQQDARNWLTKGSDDFRDICICAEWEPEYIQRGANKLAANGWVRAKQLDEALEAA